MRNAIFALLAVTAVAGSSGCCCLERMFSCNNCCDPCGGCGTGSCGWRSCNYGCGCGDSCGCGSGCGDSCGCSAGVQNCDGCGNCGVAGNKRGGNYAGDPGMFADGGDGGGYGLRNRIGPGFGPRTRGCPHCGGRGCLHCLHHHHRNDGGMGEINPGPVSAQVTYPYYTTRGPRDFLAKNPMGIGP